MQGIRSKTLRRIIIILCFVSIIMIGFFTYLQLRPMVVKGITVEAGAAIPDVKEFMLYKNRSGSYASDINTYRYPGTYPVSIKIGRKIYTSDMIIVDTLAPTAKIVDKMVLKGEEITATAFVTDVFDATDVSVTFVNEPDTSIIGDQKVKIRLEDTSGNSRQLEAVLTVLDVKSNVTVEAGSAMNISASDFIDNNSYNIVLLTDLSMLDISKVTEHEILLSIDGREVNATIQVVDTTPPNAVFQNKEVWLNDFPQAEYFVVDITDASSVTISYQTEPDFTQVGSYTATILLSDEYGNQTQGQVTYTVKQDTEAPVIHGTKDKRVYIGDAVAYKKNVTVTDNKDQNITFQVDSSEVNLKKEGIYNVIYSAVDSSGNKTTLTTTVTVEKFIVSEDMVYEKADEILNKIITEDMTKIEKAKAIYKWTKYHIAYTGDSDKSDWLKEAYLGITKGDGDCFTYFAVSQALLTRAGIDNMGVTRVGGKTHHYWNLVDCGSGWYHFDACPNKDGKDCFMLTDQEVADLTEERGRNYYTFDTSLYPVTPLE